MEARTRYCTLTLSGSNANNAKPRMNDVQDKLGKVVETIKTERDELRLQLHFFKTEAKDEWNKMEEHWRNLEPKLKQVRESVAESGEDIGAAVTQLSEEIGEGYKRIRNALHRD